MKVTEAGVGSKRLDYDNKYWGHVPRLLKHIPEGSICICNPEFSRLMELYMNKDITHRNLSKELLADVQAAINDMAVARDVIARFDYGHEVLLDGTIEYDCAYEWDCDRKLTCVVPVSNLKVINCFWYDECEIPPIYRRKKIR